ncbi:MAG: patatin-like phospholipase family protein [Campylobacteraceae bacterium]|nr:patatin-like phospholipase family protein [Campylobacteraceae bacterium]
MRTLSEEELLKVVKKLKQNCKYNLARKEILSKYDDDLIKVSNNNLSRELAQCYYKDLELNKDFSYDIALSILHSIDSDDNKKETLCLKGAIYKRKWEYKANIKDLYKSIEYYENAYIEYKYDDNGYGGINASYLYDVLAKELNDNNYSNILVKKADDLRTDIIESFKDEEKDKWLYHILAQAYFGNKDFKNCEETLKNSIKDFEYDDWEIFTTYKQLKLLGKLKNIDDLTCLLPLFDKDESHILELSLDKKGLALSGGGFRASFFHLGTLAKLAECDMLKDIEVLSTVSGGSIIGVLYYLKLQKLLEEKYDINITKDDYIELVHDLIDEFFEVVHSDIRNSVLWKSGILKTIKFLIPFNGYSRTNKLGELYQKRIYKKYKKYMKDLIITPKDWKDKKEIFKPRFNNWRRKNKIPILVINATNLNSGHNWQFQASKMGEPEYMSDLEINKNHRFDWVRYDNKGLQTKFKNFSIGQAVACSSAVPVLFTPIVLENLYEDYKLSISDGGVYDNQGFSGLLSEECDYIICSDASGQMDNQKSSTTTLYGTNKRTIDIQMDRSRELIFEDLKNRREKGILKGFLFTHLKEGLNSNEVKQEDTIQKFEENDDKEFQELISNVRTDLDVFSKTESYSLMYNGYELFERRIINNDINYIVDENWVFLNIKDNIKEKSKKLMDEIKLSKYQFTRRFRKWWRN